MNNPFIKVSISSGDKVVGVPPPIYKVSISLLLSLRSSATPLASWSNFSTYSGFLPPNLSTGFAGNEQ